MEATSRVARREAGSDPEVRGYSLLRRQGPWKDALRRRMLAAADAGASAGSLAVMGGLTGRSAGGTLAWVAALTPLWLIVARTRGLYHRDHVPIRHETVDELTDLVLWATLCVAGTALAMAVADSPSLPPRVALAMWAVAVVLVLCLRACVRTLWRRAVPCERGLVVGSGPTADGFVRKLKLEPGHHLSLSRHVRLDSGKVASGDLAGLIESEEIERVILADQDLDEATMSGVASTCRSLGVKLSVAPPLRAMLGTAVELNHLAEFPLIEFRTWHPSRSMMASKRMLDVLGAGVALFFALPLLLVIAVAIKVDSRGPVLYRQRRSGHEGRPFTMLKFRTMDRDAERQVADVVAIEELPYPMFKLRADPRVTIVGWWLRRFSLDELPQLLNVLGGQMSLVGPRPEEVWLADRYEEPDRFRLQMRPGMSGPMQVHGRGDLSFTERMAVEREYVENYRIEKDLKILLRTFAAVLRGRGAY